MNTNRVKKIKQRNVYKNLMVGVLLKCNNNKEKKAFARALEVISNRKRDVAPW